MLRSFALILIAWAPPQEAGSTLAAVVTEGKDRSQVMDHLDHLVNKIGPRLTGSENLIRAEAWARERFASYGLQARLERWGEFAVGFNRGPWSGKIVKPVEMELECGTMAWSAGTQGPVRGRALLLPESEEALAELGDAIKGAWIVVPRDRRGPAPMQNRCEEAGAAGFVLTQGSDLIQTSGSPRVRWDALPKRVNVYVVVKQHRLIVGLLRGVPQVELEFDIKNEFKQGPIPLYNVVADLKGAEKPDEFVVVGGHLDSWDGAQGTVDNGTGCATTIEAARLLAKAGARPKRTIRFMLWSGEEQGLLGSAAYVKAHRDEMNRISAVLVHDGGTNYVSGIMATDAMKPIFEQVFAPIRDLDASMPFKIRGPFRVMSGSDHFSFFTAGVPGFFWDQAGHADYRYAHHTQHDRFRQAIKEYQIHSSIVIATGAYGIANLPQLLPREGMAQAPVGGARGRRLGINYADGMIISDVTEGLPAHRAGLRVGDKLLKIGDVAVTDHETLVEALQAAPGETKLVVERGGKTVELPIKFAAARRLLGIQLGDGMAVESVTDEMPGAKAGMREGDVILDVGGQEVKTVEEMRRQLEQGSREKTVGVRRDGKRVELKISFDE
jgi:hypothetical protein